MSYQNLKTYFIETHCGKHLLCTDNSIIHYEGNIRKKVEKLLDMNSLDEFMKLSFDRRKTKIKHIIESGHL